MRPHQGLGSGTALLGPTDDGRKVLLVLPHLQHETSNLT
jgi:hypothetical protein